MAIVSLQSTNPDFSFLIKKNPATGLSLRSVRKGIAYGWYSDASRYHVYFKDADNEISYKQYEHEHFEYLNLSRYNTPLFPLHAIGEYFSAPLKSRDERDVAGYTHTFFINMVHIELVRYIAFFQNHVKDFSFEIEHRADKSYALTIRTQKSLHDLLQVTSVLCLFLATFGKEHLDISDSLLDKYIKSIQAMDAPFYIRSLFSRNFLPKREHYRKYKAALEQTDRYEIHLEYGNTGMQRRNFIAGQLPFSRPILDVGCGEGFYALAFAGKLAHCYYAVDIDEERLELVNRKAVAKEVDNIVLFPSVDSFLLEYNGEQVDIILTEVIEHMSTKEARALILQLCREVDFASFIITTPNADFNPYYELSGFRHDDHKWEMGEQAFQTWMNEIMQTAGVEGEFVKIGDQVNGMPTTQGVILRKRRA
ncbi:MULTISPECIES: class I SAM-dependent methyltransferase [Brevibacillus]|jgi:2-polyprenyl-3-methyl-5-hydroxy-6-metoxy-1,4-benzoquinol methylase|uniref:class I SAM-dependent methyltransferase n=1 Tax=Brevibacillus TaxID=55080 RepID=UPI000ED3760B|nr:MULTISPECIES: class I SAM-dependent methyltransferase [Brevibacillus]MDH6353228.1 2-polyprenyl-3-methyl-5-hydroxy-6-metoxy-1,4-benzoquinol methylase [Brevibacillus sp. 1238]HBZ82124.1 SAM-dependent methyltransferase [Brevibacillus sp.]